MNITFPKVNDFEWPAVFEYHLHSTSALEPVRTRAQHRCTGPDAAYERVNQRFQASGYDDEDFHGAGWLNQLPSQQGISGWKRMTMMKYFEDGEGGWDNNALWAYEGVVLPGGQVMLGRWWSPEEPVAGREVNLESPRPDFHFTKLTSLTIALHWTLHLLEHGRCLRPRCLRTAPEERLLILSFTHMEGPGHFDTWSTSLADTIPQTSWRLQKRTANLKHERSTI